MLVALGLAAPTVAPGAAGTTPAPAARGVVITATGAVSVGPAAVPDAGATTAPAFMAGRPAAEVTVTSSAPADGVYHPVGTLTVGFGGMVRGPRVHLFGLGSSIRLAVVGGDPAAPAVVPRAGWSGWLVTSSQIAARPGAGGCGCGTVQLFGTFAAVTFRVDTAAGGATGGFRVSASADEDLGNAPASYGTVAHLLSDLTIGPSVTADGPVDLGDGGAVGRAPTDANDGGVVFPPVSGPAYAVDVPVHGVSGAAELAGWIDFDGDGRFGAGERARVAVPAGSTTARLVWSPVPTVVPAAGQARLRLGYDAAEVDEPTGLATSGEVEDFPVRMYVRPAILAPAANGLLRARTPVISGTAEAGGAVTVTEGGTALCRVDVTAAGTWACTPTAALADGAHTVVVTNVATDGDQQSGPAVAFRVDGTAPAVPVLIAPADRADIATGRPAWRGSGEPGATVTVTAGSATAGASVDVCHTTVDADGAWSCETAASLADGAYRLAVVAVDPAGNSSPTRVATISVDTTPPPAPAITAPVDGATVNGRPVTVVGTGEAGATVTVASGAGDALCVAAVATDTTWACTVPGDRPDGPLVLTATATDAAGNSTPGEPVTATLDSTAPPAPAITRPAPGSAVNNASPVVRGTGEAGDTVRVDAGAAACHATVPAAGRWSCRLAPPLPGTAPTGDTVTLRTAQTDRAGNTTPGTPTRILLDTVAPPAATATAPGPVVNAARPAFSGRSEPGSTVVVTVGGATACTVRTGVDGVWGCVATRALPAGRNTVVLTARDRAGNATTSAPWALTVDTTPPPPPTIDSPVGVTNQNRPTIGGRGEAGDTIEVNGADGATLCTTTAGAAGTWSCTAAAAIGDGPASLTATATDPAGNVTPGESAVVTVDTTAPAAASVMTPDSGSYLAERAPLIAGAAEPGATVTVADATGLAVCTTVVGSIASAHPAGSDGPDRWGGSGPDRWGGSGPVGLVGRVGSADPVSGSAGWECRPSRPFGDGPQRLVATVTDPAGNSTPGDAVTFTVDTVAPAAPRLTAPAAGLVTRDARIAPAGTAEPGSLVAVDARGDLLCTGTAGPDGTWHCRATADVADGAVPLRATAADRAGNATSGATVTVTVDTAAPPAASITSPVPGEIVLTATPVIEGTGEADDTVIVEGSGGRTVCLATVQAGGGWSCPAFDELPDGDFTLNTYALDAAGNSTHGTAIRIRIGSAQPVAATITAPGDGAIVAGATPMLSGQGTPGDTVEVLASAGGRAAVTACVAVVEGAGDWSCRPVTPLPQGRVTLMPTTIDADGTQIPGSAVAVTVDSAPPAAPTLTSPHSGAIVRTATPTLSGRGEAGSVVEVTGADGGTACAATVTAGRRWSCTPATPLAAGPAYLTPTATDAAGNVTPGTPVRFTVTP